MSWISIEVILGQGEESPSEGAILLEDDSSRMLLEDEGGALVQE